MRTFPIFRRILRNIARRICNVVGLEPSTRNMCKVVVVLIEGGSLK